MYVGGWRIAVATKHELCLSMNGVTPKRRFTKRTKNKRGSEGWGLWDKTAPSMPTPRSITTELGPNS